jgi:hypothetical protein
MQARLLVLAACLLAPSCDDSKAPRDREADAPAASPSPDPHPTSDASTARPRPEPPDPWQTQLASRVLAPSGLAPGSTLVPFECIHTESGDAQCPTSRADATPTIIAVGTADDEGFRRDLQDLDAIVHKYAGQLAAVAVITELEDGRARTARDPQTARDTARELARRLRVSLPMVVPAPVQPGQPDVWAAYYNVTTSGTVMLANGDDEVVFWMVEPEDWFALDAALRPLLARSNG